MTTGWSHWRSNLFWALFFAAAILLFAHPAFAQAAGGWGNFSCSNGQASGTLYDPGNQCPHAIAFDNVFSFLVCNMEHLSANLMGSMYCGIIQEAIPAINAVLTIAVVFFGIGFTTGIIPATAREFQMFLIKIAFVWVFATQAEYLIGIGYRFLVTGAREGISIVMGGLLFKDQGGADATGADIYKYLDSFLGKTMQYATDAAGLSKQDPNGCKNAIFAVIAIMMIVFPPLFYIAVALIVKVAFTFLRSVFGYVYAIVALAFLLTMAPLFLSFFLFRATRQFFDKWVGYLVSFSLQMVIVFAFLAVIVSIPVSHLTSTFTEIIIPKTDYVESTSFRFPWEYCTMCDFRVVNADTGAEITQETYSAKDYLGKGKLVCKDNPPKPIDVTTTVSPPTDANSEVQSALVKFAATALLSLLVLAYIVDMLLSYVPALAQNLSAGMGGVYAPQLVGGSQFGDSRPSFEMPGGRMLDTIDHGFTDGYVHYMKTSGSSSNTLGATTAGFKEAAARMMFGGSNTTLVGPDGKAPSRFSGSTSQEDPGLVDSIFGFFVNPNPD